MAKIKSVSVAPGASVSMPKMARRPGFSSTKLPKMQTTSSDFPKVKMPKAKTSKAKIYKSY